MQATRCSRQSPSRDRPNFAPNFTTAKMTDEALRDAATISYSGGEYGRPLCHSEDAGRRLAAAVRERSCKKGLAWHRLGCAISAYPLVRDALWSPSAAQAEVSKNGVRAEEEDVEQRGCWLPSLQSCTGDEAACSALTA